MPTQWEHTLSREERYQQKEKERMSRWKAGLSQLSTEKEQIKYFKRVVNKELNKLDKSNENRHAREEYRDFFDPCTLDREDEFVNEENDTLYVPAAMTKLCQPDNWDNYIFSKRPDDIHELVTDRALVLILKTLKFNRKEALYLRAIAEYSAEEISQIKSISDRYMRRLYSESVDLVRYKITPIIRFKRKLETEEEFKEIAEKRYVFTTPEERAFIEQMGEQYDGYYN